MPNHEAGPAAPVAAIRSLIVDDEPLARENPRLRLRNASDFEIVGECATGREALGAVAALKPDVLFIDIRMPDMDGLAVVERIDVDILPVVVFVTAYDRYALEAFRLHAIDYLLKPFDDDRFSETLDTCRRRVNQGRRLTSAPPRARPRSPRRTWRHSTPPEPTRTRTGSSSRIGEGSSS